VSKRTTNEAQEALVDAVNAVSANINNDLYIRDNVAELCTELSRRFMRLKDQLLCAWFARYGFDPGKATIVEDRSQGLSVYYIRESTPEESDRASAIRDTTTPRCTCQVKTTEVPGMVLLYAKADCPEHGKYHNKRLGDQ